MEHRKRINTKGSDFKSKKPVRKRVKVEKTHSEEEAIEIKNKKMRFISYYKEEGMTISKTLKKCGIPSQQKIYDWMSEDPLFREQYYVIRKQKDPLSFNIEQKKIKLEAAQVPMSLEDGEDVKAIKNALIEAYRFSSFNLAVACDEVGIQRQQVAKWLQNDEDFKLRMDDVDEEKKDLVESSLLQKVASGDTAAIIYASKCLLSGANGRGYDETNTLNARIDVVHSKETSDAVVEAAQITPTTSALLDTPAGQFLIAKMNEAKEEDIIDTEVEEVEDRDNE